MIVLRAASTLATQVRLWLLVSVLVLLLAAVGHASLPSRSVALGSGGAGSSLIAVTPQDTCSGAHVPC